MIFFQKYKKFFLIIAFLSFSVLIGYLNYLLFFKSSTITPKTKTTTPQTGTLPASDTGTGFVINENNKEGLPKESKKPQKATPKIDKIARGNITKINKINNRPTSGLNIAPQSGDLRFYDKKNGKFYKLKNGKMEELSDKVFHNVKKITWSKGNENKAILEYPDGSNIIYNFKTKKQITLPKHWKDFDFSPRGDKIISKSIALDPENRWLIVSGSNGEKTIALERLGDKDETVFPLWSPNNQIAAMFTESKGFDKQEVYFVGLNKENFKSTTIEGRGFDPKWSKKGDKLLYSVYSDKTNLKPNLWIVAAEGESIGQNRKNLNIQTWANKCVFADNQNIYCAVPKNLQDGAGMFPEIAKTTDDILYQINTQNKTKKIIAIPDKNISMSNLVVDEKKENLYFTDAKTNQLYTIKLK